MIRIKCGTCGTSQGYKTAADGKLTLSREEEARLVARGVADYVTRPVLNAVPDAGTPAGGMEQDGQGIPLPDSENAAEGMAEDGGNIPAYSMDMKADSLRSLMKQHDIPCRVGMSKAEMVAALDAVFHPAAEDREETAADGEAPPELDAEGPVI